MILLILAGILAVLFYLKFVKVHEYWKNKGVPYIKPWPILGNMGPTVFQKRAVMHLIQDMYNQGKGNRYVGMYQFLQPTLLLRDPALIKQITVRDFNTFPNHAFFALSDDENDLTSKVLVTLTYERGWHDMRTMLSPTFTSSKLRTMFRLMEQCADQFVAHFEKQPGIVEISARDAFPKYTSDVVATTVFGLTCDSLEHPDNDFYLRAKDLTDIRGLRLLIFFAYSVIPTVMKFLGLTPFSTKSFDYFSKIIRQTMQLRKEKNIVRPDMVHIMMEAKKGNSNLDEQSGVIDSGFAVIKESEVRRSGGKLKKKLTDDDLVALGITFIAAGSDTTSTMLAYATYELAVNPDIQLRLQKEVDAVTKSCNGELTYEALLGMKYLDCVVSEALRKWPPAPIVDRLSVAPFTLEPEQPGEKEVHLERGTLIWIPTVGIHYDPEYYPNPEKFDPDRFSEENKHNIQPFTYLPFGVGPRSCMGTRFALLKGKLLLYKILQKYDIVPIAKTQIPLEICKKELILLSKDGIWVGFKPRTATM